MEHAKGRSNALSVFGASFDVMTEIEARFFTILMAENFFPDTNQVKDILKNILTAMKRSEFRRPHTITQELNQMDLSGRH
jgi:hypothetical protein